jgi:hypothetical protein
MLSARGQDPGGPRPARRAARSHSRCRRRWARRPASPDSPHEGFEELAARVGRIGGEILMVLGLGLGRPHDIHRPLEEDRLVGTHAGVPRDGRAQGLEVHEIERVGQGHERGQEPRTEVRTRQPGDHEFLRSRDICSDRRTRRPTASCTAALARSAARRPPRAGGAGRRAGRGNRRPAPGRARTPSTT